MINQNVLKLSKYLEYFSLRLTIIFVHLLDVYFFLRLWDGFSNVASKNMLMRIDL